MVPPLDEYVLKIAELDSDDIEAIKDSIDEEVKKAEAFFQ